MIDSEEALRLYEESRDKLLSVIDYTNNVTLLKKIIASGELEDEAFDKLTDIAFNENNGEALLEVMMLCKKSGKMKKKVESKTKFLDTEV